MHPYAWFMNLDEPLSLKLVAPFGCGSFLCLGLRVDIWFGCSSVFLCIWPAVKRRTRTSTWWDMVRSMWSLDRLALTSIYQYIPVSSGKKEYRTELWSQYISFGRRLTYLVHTFRLPAGLVLCYCLRTDKWRPSLHCHHQLSSIINYQPFWCYFWDLVRLKSDGAVSWATAELRPWTPKSGKHWIQWPATISHLVSPGVVFTFNPCNSSKIYDVLICKIDDWYPSSCSMLFRDLLAPSSHEIAPVDGCHLVDKYCCASLRRNRGIFFQMFRYVSVMNLWSLKQEQK